MADLKDLYRQLKEANETLKLVIAAANADGNVNFIEQATINAFKEGIKAIQAKIKEVAGQETAESKVLEVDIFSEYGGSEKASSPYLFTHTKVTGTLAYGQQKGMKEGMMVVAGGKFRGWIEKVFPVRSQVTFLVINEKQKEELATFPKVTVYTDKKYTAAEFDKTVEKTWNGLVAKYGSAPIPAQLIQGLGTSESEEGVYTLSATIGFLLPSGFKWINFVKKNALVTFGRYQGRIVEVFDNSFNRAKVAIYLKSEILVDDVFKNKGEIHLNKTYSIEQFKKQLEKEAAERNDEIMENMRGGHGDLTKEEAKETRGK